MRIAQSSAMLIGVDGYATALGRTLVMAQTRPRGAEKISVNRAPINHPQA
jgi:hypothetical protein